MKGKSPVLMLVLIIGFSAPLHAGEVRIHDPKVDGYALDYCRDWAKNCGQPAADAYCKSRGYQKALSYKKGDNTPPTRVISSGQVCDSPHCDRMTNVTCLAADTPKSPEVICSKYLQGRIAWDYNGSKQWNQSNINTLCNGTTNGKEPARCFNKVMHGNINWGGGTQWQWGNAVNLCAGTGDAAETIRCFEKKISKGKPWEKAIKKCKK